MSIANRYNERGHMKNADETAIEGLVQAFVEGWNTADGTALARPFAPDADFIAITGLKGKGRVTSAKALYEIIAPLYPGSVSSAKVERFSFLRPDVGVADVTLRFVDEGRPIGLEQTSCGMVCAKEDGTWSIA